MFSKTTSPMEQNQNCCASLRDRLPPLSANFPWLVAQNLEAKDETQVQIFYSIDDSLPHYHCQIPELLGRFIHGCFHGWVILSDHPHNVMWSLWNPITSEIICLPPLLLKDDDSDYIEGCWLSSPPDDPNSILLLPRLATPNIVFCRLDCKENKLRWTEMSYAEQVRNLFDLDGFLRCLSYCNDKVYALVLLKPPPTRGDHHRGNQLVQVDIVVKDDTEVLISLLPILDIPYASFFGFHDVIPFLKGSCTELFIILVAFKDEMRTTVGDVCLFKLNMSSITWEEMDDLKDTVMFVELTSDVNSVFYSTAVTTKLGGYIHILGDKDKIYSYHVKDKTLSLSSVPCLVGTSHVSAWAMLECRFEGDHVEGECTTDFKQEKEDTDNEIVVRSDDEVKFNSRTDESHLLNIPFHLLEMIMKFNVGIEYLKFRATCKRCHLEAPLIQWSNKTASKRLQTYSLISPWLMVFDKHQGIITFTDPMFGDKYFINTPQDLICDFKIYCSKDGWLLLRIDEGPLLFFNPFTRDIRKLPEAYYLEGFCFSAPPTSPDCMVVGFGSGEWYICFVAREPSWRSVDMYLDGNPYTCSYLTFSGREILALCNEGKVDVFEDMDKEDFSWGPVVSKAPTSCGSLGQYFLVNCDRGLLLVIVGKHGESVEVFTSNDDEEKWEKIDGIGRHTIYICDTTCLCIEARTPKMENKIYFPRSRSKNGNMVFYSLETCRYHTSNGDNSEENFGDFLGTKHHLSPHVWIEPSWS